MKILKNLVSRIVRWSISNDITVGEEPSLYRGGTSVRSSNNLEGNNGMNFVVYSATGGKVIQLNSYDHVKDRTQSKLYIVTDKENLGEEIAHIITVECLTR